MSSLLHKLTFLQKSGLLLFFVLLVVSNVVTIDLIFGGQLFFGSIFVFIILKVYGKKYTLVVSSIIFVVKIVFMGFSYELLLLFFEMLFVTWRYNNKKENLLITVIIYWVVIATPFTFIWGYVQNIHYEESMSYLITIMQLNGLLNAAIADASTNFTTFFQRLLNEPKKQLPELRVLLFDIMVISLVVPLVLYISLTSLNVLKHVEESIKVGIVQKEQSIQNEIKSWSRENQLLLKLEDQVLLKYLDDKFKQERVNSWYSFLLNEKGEYMTAPDLPMKQSGYLVAIEEGYNRFYEEKSGFFFKEYFKWKQSWYIYSTKLLGYNLIIMTPLENYSIAAMHTFFQYVPLIVLIISPILIVVYYFTKLYMKSHFKLIAVTKDLPEKINSGIEVEWPTSDTLELNLFTQHFKEVAIRLGDMFTKSKELNEQLLLKSTQLEQSKEDLKVMAFTDTLTGLPNRLKFHDILDKWINSVDSATTTIAVIFIDLDKFKLINDTLGHSIGDQLLQEAANRIDHTFDHKSSQLVARLGGDEFVVLIQGADKETLRKCVIKLLEELNQEYNLSGHLLHSFGSVGVSIFPQDGQLVEDVVRKADIAMYEAKGRGGNVWCFYDEVKDNNTIEHNEAGDPYEK